MDVLAPLSHHAYLLTGNGDEIIPQIFAVIGPLHGIREKGDPNVLVLRFGTLGIDDARDLRAHAHLSGFGGGKKIIIIRFESITGEAQNALLKTIEEPPPGTHFFFVTNSPGALLPTVRSRLLMISVGDDDECAGGPTVLAGRTFLAASLAERMKMIEPIHKDKKLKEDGLHKREARRILDGIEEALSDRVDDPAVRATLHDVLVAKRYLTQTPMLKILLEEIALTAPLFR